MKIMLICGESSTGKTTVSQLIRDKTPGAEIISQDDYFRDFSSLSNVEIAETNFELKDAYEFSNFEGDILKILDGYEVHLPVYDFKTHKSKAQRIVNRPSLLIVEGVHVFYSTALLNIAAIKIYLHAPLDIIFMRRVVRNFESRSGDLNEIVGRYINFLRPEIIRRTSGGERDEVCDMHFDSFICSAEEIADSCLAKI